MTGLLGRDRCTWLVASCVGLALGVTRPACAETGLLVPMETTLDPRYLPDSEALSLQAQGLLQEDRIAPACSKLAESQLRAPRLSTLLNLAACHEAEGKLGISFSEFTEALALAEGEERPEFVKLAQPHIAALTPCISRLTVIVPQEIAALAPEVRLDGEPLPTWGAEVPLDPGQHRLEARAEGCPWWSAELKLDAGERRAETIPSLSCNDPVPVHPPRAAAAAPEDHGGSRKEQRRFAAGLAALGGLGLALGIGLEAGNDPEHDAHPQCGIIGSSGRPHCSGVANRHAKAAVMFGVGLASLTTGLVLWIHAQPPSHNVALMVGVAPGALHARVTW